MKITKHPTAPMYKSAKGNDVFRYIVSGTPEELAAYKTAKDSFYREDEALKQPLFFSSRNVGKEAELRKTSDGKDFVVNDDELRAFASLVKEYGIDVAKWKMEQDKISVPAVNIEPEKK